jgi:phage/conjugal plasmid C-4 type zinc finger TraR family protein
LIYKNKNHEEARLANASRDNHKATTGAKVCSGLLRESEMATGWAGDGAVQDQIDATVKDGISRAVSRLPQGQSLTHCADCGNQIPEARRNAIPGVRLCLSCQEAEDREVAAFSGYNRRGSKDSQLR